MPFEPSEAVLSLIELTLRVVAEAFVAKRFVAVALVKTDEEPKTDCSDEDAEKRFVNSGVPEKTGDAAKTAAPLPVSSVRIPARRFEVLIDDVASESEFTVAPVSEILAPAEMGAW